MKNVFFQLFFVSLKMDVNFANKQIIYSRIHLHVYVPFFPQIHRRLVQWEKFQTSLINEKRVAI